MAGFLFLVIAQREDSGHSYMTRSLLFKGEEALVCIPCDELLTIELVLLFCSDLIEGLIKEAAFYSSVTDDFV